MTQPHTYMLIERDSCWHVSHNETEDGPFSSLNAAFKHIRRLYKSPPQTTPEIPNSYFMMHTANAIFRAAQAALPKQIISEPNEPLPDTFESDIRIAPILLPLATETILKAYFVLEYLKPPPYNHDLLYLYKRLTPNTRNHLELQLPLLPTIHYAPNLYTFNPFDPDRSTYLTLSDIFLHHKDDFVTFRYIDQQPPSPLYPLTFHHQDLEIATEILIKSFMTIFYKYSENR